MARVGKKTQTWAFGCKTLNFATQCKNKILEVDKQNSSEFFFWNALFRRRKAFSHLKHVKQANKQTVEQTYCTTLRKFTGSKTLSFETLVFGKNVTPDTYVDRHKNLQRAVAKFGIAMGYQIIQWNHLCRLRSVYKPRQTSGVRNGAEQKTMP